MRKLQAAFLNTVKHVLRGLPPEEFQVHFPEEVFPGPILEVLYNAYIQVKNRPAVESLAIAGWQAGLGAPPPFG